MKKTIEDLWNSYVKAVMPPDAPQVQHIEMRRAFYAGTAAMFELVMDISDLDEAQSEKYLSRLEKELTDYATTIGAPNELPPLPPHVEEKYEIKNKSIQDRLRLLGRHVSKGIPPGWGFALLMFTFGEKGSLFYISNGDRADVLETMREFIARETTPKHKH